MQLDLTFPAAYRQRAQSLAPAEGKSWYRIQNAKSDEAKVYVYDVIAWYGISADQFAHDLDEISARTIHLHINSPGGDVFDGVAIYNALRNHKAKVITHVDGVAASIASIIAMAGDEVRMSEGAFMMVHNPWMLVIGDAADLRESADFLDKVRGSLVGIYARATGKAEKDIGKLMDAETWLTAEEARDEGFADVIEASDDEPQDAWDLSVFANAPAALADRRSQRPGPRKMDERPAAGTDDETSDEVVVRLSAAMLSTRVALASR